MNIFEQALAFTVPAAFIGGIVFLVLNKMLKAEDARRNFELRKIAAKEITPAKLRAFERMVLFLERIEPEAILTRSNITNLSPLQLQKYIIQQIKQEWDHNLSQQLYIKNETWTLIWNAKESLIQLTNICAAEVTLDSTALEYAEHIIETYSKAPKKPSSVAINMLKADLLTIR